MLLFLLENKLSFFFLTRVILFGLTCSSFFLLGLAAGYAVRTMVELVDVFPTLSSLAGLPRPPYCPTPSFKVQLCTEGFSLARLLGRREWVTNHQAVAYSQYPRPSDTIQHNSDLPDLADIRIMGYSVRSNDYRYTLWVGFDPVHFQANLTDIHAGELYILGEDPGQDHNIFDEFTLVLLKLGIQPQWTESLKQHLMYFRAASKTKWTL